MHMNAHDLLMRHNILQAIIIVYRIQCKKEISGFKKTWHMQLKITSSDVTKAPGLAKISSKFLKDGAEVLALPLCNLVNLSTKQSLFLDQCKIAKLKPLFKEGSKSDPKNYRPISLLPVVFKIIEKTIQIQT